MPYEVIFNQVGRQKEAIELTWSMIERHTREKTEMKDYVRPPFIDCEKLKLQNVESKVNILCVKWGKKYGPDYVNKLFYGIKSNTTKEFNFYCFTDDPTGLHKDIIVIPLKENWEGWWGKATLFSSGEFSLRVGVLIVILEFNIKGCKVFIDLDMIITGNIDEILSFDKVKLFKFIWSVYCIV